MQYDFGFLLSLTLPLVLLGVGVLLLLFPAQSFYRAILILKRLNIVRRYPGEFLDGVLRLYQQDKVKFAQQYGDNIQTLRQSGVAFLVMAVIACLILFWF